MIDGRFQLDGSALRIMVSDPSDPDAEPLVYNAELSAWQLDLIAVRMPPGREREWVKMEAAKARA